MVESLTQYKNLLNDISSHPIILYAIGTDTDLHPSINSLSVVFIKDALTKKTYSISFNHSDLPIVIDKKTFLNDLNGLKNKKCVFDKKSFLQLVGHVDNLWDINLMTYLSNAFLIEDHKFITSAHKFIYRNHNGHRGLNNVVPILKHQQMFEEMCLSFIVMAFVYKLDDGYFKENQIIIETLSEIESNGIYVDEECFGKHFSAPVIDDYVYSQYNLYTPTGRPSNHFDNVNYAALNKENGERSCFVSRHGSDGKMVLIDYSAFHPRIICNLVNFPLSIDVDIYKYLGELYFQREITDYDLDEAKKLTFRQLYGGVEARFEKIKYFSQLKSFVEDSWNSFEKDGYVLTPIFKRRITNKHVLDPNPNKLFNYILQATETEVAVSILKEINTYLKPKKTKSVLYTYDSILFDFHKDDGASTLQDISTIMKMGEKYPIKIYAGNSYSSLTQILP